MGEKRPRNRLRSVGGSDWQQLIVYRDTNGTKEGFERISHALGFFLYPHAPRHEDVRHAQVEPDLRRWQRSSVFSHRQVIPPIGAEGLDRRGPAGSCRLFLGPGFRLAARWNRLVETVKTRKR